MKHCKIILGVLLFATALLVVGLTATDQISTGNSKGLELGKVSSLNYSTTASTLQTEAENHNIPHKGVQSTNDGKQGGETIATALAITTMPFSETGTTTGYADDYEEDCAGEGDQVMPDVVYSFTPTAAGLLNVSTCNSSYFTRLWMYKTTEDTLFECNRFHSNCGTPPRAALVDIELDSNITYYIVIDGDILMGDGSGTYDISCTYEEYVDLDDSTLLHPAISENSSGGMMLAWEENATDTGLFWWGSTNGGANITGASWTGVYHYPSLSYWGEGNVFYGTAVPDASEGGGAPISLITFPDPSNTGSWAFSTWSFESYGWHDMKDADIACDNTKEFPMVPGEFRAGVISMVHSTTYSDQMTNGPHLFYQTDSSSVGTISWHWLDGCNSTSITIDRGSKLLYAVWDYFDPDSSQWQLFVRREIFGDPDDTLSSEAFTHSLSELTEHAMYPQVGAYDSNIVIVSERYADATPEDRDIICWYNTASDGSIASLTTSVVTATTDDERFPRVQHVGGTVFAATFVRGDTLMAVVSADAGANWGTPFAISLVPGDEVVSEYKFSDLSENALKAIWEYKNAGDADTSIFVHYNSITIDSDGDMVNDVDDNCPTVSNAGQENDDNDSYGNACDNCPNHDNETQVDADGDGNGDACDLCPGYDDNLDADADTVPDDCDICPGFDDLADGDGDTVPDSCDNCPDVANTDQADANGNDVGDVCDYVCGDANGDGDVNVGDAVYLINFAFKGGPAPDPLEAGMANCDDEVNVGDAVYLINFAFKGGPAPCDCP
ncbi:MAG: thrombospondin type 3 repeat-containing protein [candidate division Zixibacteria bacterium]|nr:thrombospondin type 3 repeat-containing protein [candidate division Zixibacteria bacterium]